MTQQSNSVRRFLKPTVYTLAICIAVGFIFGCLYLFKEIFMVFDKTRISSCYTFKLGDTDPEYVTYEHLNDKHGNDFFKVSFHKGIDNPGIDYVIVSCGERDYPPMQWCYLKGDDRKLCIEDNGVPWFQIDTIVCQEYEIHAANSLWSWADHLTPQEIEREQQLFDSLEYYPFKMWVYPEDFNRIGYTQSPYRKMRDNDNKIGRVVRRGK